MSGENSGLHRRWYVQSGAQFHLPRRPGDRADRVVCSRPPAPSAFVLEPVRSALEQMYPVGLTDNRHLSHVEKQPTINHCWNSKQPFLESHRVRDWPEAAVEDIVAIIGDPRLAIGAAP